MSAMPGAYITGTRHRDEVERMRSRLSRDAGTKQDPYYEKYQRAVRKNKGRLTAIRQMQNKIRDLKFMVAERDEEIDLLRGQLAMVERYSEVQET